MIISLSLLKGGEKKGIAKGLKTVLTERFGEEAVKGTIYFSPKLGKYFRFAKFEAKSKTN